MWSQPPLAQFKSDRLLLLWNLLAIVVAVFPLMVFTVGRASYSNGEDDDEQDEQEAQGYYDEDGVWVQYQQPHWWQFWKSSSNNGDQDQDDNDNDAGVPWWYVWGEEREPEEQGQGTLVFIYIWILALFVTMTLYGNHLLAQGSTPLVQLQWALIGFGNTCFLVCLLTAGLDAIQVEGREIEETGFYGQTAVLVFLTCLFGIVYSVLFSFWVRRRIKLAGLEEKQVQEEDKIHGYQLHEKSSVGAGLEMAPSKGSEAIVL